VELARRCIESGSRKGDTVLDPIFGSGTVGKTAQMFGREWIGCELNPEYAPLQQARTAQAALAI
jgi:site-specific DNA-methyltransferase (cytosine-N4-specific)